MFTPSEVKARWKGLNQARVDKGEDPLKASLNLALFIASSALIEAKLWSGDDYMEHPLTVGFHGTESTAKRIIGILHDVVEDSDWTLEDLKEIGFDDRILNGIDGVTKRESEHYFNFIERCGMSGADAIDIKLKDLSHNSQNTRTPTITRTEKQAMKQDVYNISYFYLLSIKKNKIKAETSLTEFALKEYGVSEARLSQLFSSFYKENTTQKPHQYKPKV